MMFKKKSLIALVSLLVVLCIGVGGTLAYLVATDEPVTNTFQIHEISTSVEEDFNNQGLKKDVTVKNTGTTDAYIRAAVVVTWQDAQGNVYGQKPVTDMNCEHNNCDCDYAIEFNTGNNKWIQSGDYYYWHEAVKSVKDAPGNCSTGVLIKECSYLGNAPTGYNLCVEILGSGIQAKGITDNVLAAWGVDPTVD